MRTYSKVTRTVWHRKRTAELRAKHFPYWIAHQHSVKGWENHRRAVQAWKKRNPEANRVHRRRDYAKFKATYGGHSGNPAAHMRWLEAKNEVLLNIDPAQIIREAVGAQRILRRKDEGDVMKCSKKQFIVKPKRKPKSKRKNCG